MNGTVRILTILAVTELFQRSHRLLKLSLIRLQNIRFAKDYLRTESIPVESSDVGLIYPRKVNFFPKSGRVMVKRLTSLHNDTIVSREQSYRDTLSTTDVSGDVELF